MIYAPTRKPGPVSVSVERPFSPISVVLLPCSQVYWHCPFRHVRLQISGAMTTLKRSRPAGRSAPNASLWTPSQKRKRWEMVRGGMLASLSTPRGRGRVRGGSARSLKGAQLRRLLSGAEHLFSPLSPQLKFAAPRQKKELPTCSTRLLKDRVGKQSLLFFSSPARKNKL